MLPAPPAGHCAGGPGADAPHPPGPGAQLLGVLLRDPQLTGEGLPPGEAGGQSVFGPLTACSCLPSGNRRADIETSAAARGSGMQKGGRLT